MFENVLYIFAQIVNLLFVVIDVAMLVRAITSWIPDIDGAWLDFVYMVTEPIIVPVRSLFEKIPAFKNSPIDFSFMIAYMLVLILQELFAMFTSAVLR